MLNVIMTLGKGGSEVVMIILIEGKRLWEPEKCLKNVMLREMGGEA